MSLPKANNPKQQQSGGGGRNHSAAYNLRHNYKSGQNKRRSGGKWIPRSRRSDQ